MTLHVCDLCKKNSPDAKIKYKYKAKRFWYLWYEGGWERIELCQECLDKIIKADMKDKSCSTCKNSNDEFSGECYECVKNIQNHYEPQESEETE